MLEAPTTSTDDVGALETNTKTFQCFRRMDRFLHAADWTMPNTTCRVQHSHLVREEIKRHALI